MSLFGPLPSFYGFESNLESFLESYFPAYLAEVERQNGIIPGSYKAPRSYGVYGELDTFPEDALPAVIVVAGTTQDVDVQSDDRSHSAILPFTVGVFVSSDSRKHTREAAYLYAAAVRGIVIQHQTLGGMTAGVEYVRETIDAADGVDTNNRTLAVGAVQFNAHLQDIVIGSAGPATPPVDPSQPSPDDPKATQTHIMLTKKDADETV